MKSGLYGILSICCTLALFEECVYAAGYEYNSVTTSNNGYNRRDSYKNVGYSSGSGGYGQQQEEESESDYYPFTKGTGQLDRQRVIGMRVNGQKLVLLGEDKKYYEETGQKDVNFDEVDSFTRYPRLLSVELSNMKLTSEVLENLQKYLPKTLRSLIVNSCSIENNDFEEFTDIVSRNKQLESLKIILPDCAEAESEKLISVVGDLKTIRYLCLTLGELGAGACGTLKDVLTRSAKTLTGVSLGFGKVESGESYNEMLTDLRQLKKLKRMEYSVLGSTAEDVGLFFEALANMTKLKELKFCFADFNDHDPVSAYDNARNFNLALEKLSDLEELDISNMNLPSAVTQVMMQGVGSLHNLRTINISGNPLDASAARVLSESMKKTEKLVTLIANNCEMTDDAFSALCGNLQNSSIKHMYFGNNKLENSLRSLQISQMRELRAVNFSYNNIKLPDIVDFMKTIPDDTKLEITNWEGNDFKGLSEKEQMTERNKLKIWKQEHRVHTLDLGI